MMNPLEFEVALPPSAVLSAASATLGSSPVVIVSRHEALEIWMQRSLGSVSSKESSLVSVWTRQDLLEPGDRVSYMLTFSRVGSDCSLEGDAIFVLTSRLHWLVCRLVAKPNSTACLNVEASGSFESDQPDDLGTESHLSRDNTSHGSKAQRTTRLVVASTTPEKRSDPTRGTAAMQHTSDETVLAMAAWKGWISLVSIKHATATDKQKGWDVGLHSQCPVPQPWGRTFDSTSASVDEMAAIRRTAAAAASTQQGSARSLTTRVTTGSENRSRIGSSGGGVGPRAPFSGVRLDEVDACATTAAGGCRVLSLAFFPATHESNLPLTGSFGGGTEQTSTSSSPPALSTPQAAADSPENRHLNLAVLHDDGSLNAAVGGGADNGGGVCHVSGVRWSLALASDPGSSNHGGQSNTSSIKDSKGKKGSSSNFNSHEKGSIPPNRLSPLFFMANVPASTAFSPVSLNTTSGGVDSQRSLMLCVSTHEVVVMCPSQGVLLRQQRWSPEISRTVKRGNSENSKVSLLPLEKDSLASSSIQNRPSLFLVADSGALAAYQLISLKDSALSGEGKQGGNGQSSKSRGGGKGSDEDRRASVTVRCSTLPLLASESKQAGETQGQARAGDHEVALRTLWMVGVNHSVPSSLDPSAVSQSLAEPLRTLSQSTQSNHLILAGGPSGCVNVLRLTFPSFPSALGMPHNVLSAYSSSSPSSSSTPPSSLEPTLQILEANGVFTNQEGGPAGERFGVGLAQSVLAPIVDLAALPPWDDFVQNLEPLDCEDAHGEDVSTHFENDSLARSERITHVPVVFPPSRQALLSSSSLCMLEKGWPLRRILCPPADLGTGQGIIKLFALALPPPTVARSKQPRSTSKGGGEAGVSERSRHLLVLVDGATGEPRTVRLTSSPTLPIASATSAQETSALNPAPLVTLEAVEDPCHPFTRFGATEHDESTISIGTLEVCSSSSLMSSTSSQQQPERHPTTSLIVHATSRRLIILSTAIEDNETNSQEANLVEWRPGDENSTASSSSVFEHRIVAMALSPKSSIVTGGSSRSHCIALVGVVVVRPSGELQDKKTGPPSASSSRCSPSKSESCNLRTQEQEEGQGLVYEVLVLGVGTVDDKAFGSRPRQQQGGGSSSSCAQIKVLGKSQPFTRAISQIAIFDDDDDDDDDDRNDVKHVAVKHRQQRRAVVAVSFWEFNKSLDLNNGEGGNVGGGGGRVDEALTGPLVLVATTTRPIPESFTSSLPPQDDAPSTLLTVFDGSLPSSCPTLSSASSSSFQPLRRPLITSLLLARLLEEEGGGGDDDVPSLPMMVAGLSNGSVLVLEWKRRSVSLSREAPSVANSSSSSSSFSSSYSSFSDKVGVGHAVVFQTGSGSCAVDTLALVPLPRHLTVAAQSPTNHARPRPTTTAVFGVLANSDIDAVIHRQEGASVAPLSSSSSLSPSSTSQLPLFRRLAATRLVKVRDNDDDDDDDDGGGDDGEDDAAEDGEDDGDAENEKSSLHQFLRRRRCVCLLNTSVGTCSSSSSSSSSVGGGDENGPCLAWLEGCGRLEFGKVDVGGRTSLIPINPQSVPVSSSELLPREVSKTVSRSSNSSGSSGRCDTGRISGSSSKSSSDSNNSSGGLAPSVESSEANCSPSLKATYHCRQLVQFSRGTSATHLLYLPFLRAILVATKSEVGGTKSEVGSKGGRRPWGGGERGYLRLYQCDFDGGSGSGGGSGGGGDGSDFPEVWSSPIALGAEVTSLSLAPSPPPPLGRPLRRRRRTMVANDGGKEDREGGDIRTSSVKGLGDVEALKSGVSGGLDPETGELWQVVAVATYHSTGVGEGSCEEENNTDTADDGDDGDDDSNNRPNGGMSPSPSTLIAFLEFKCQPNGGSRGGGRGGTVVEVEALGALTTHVDTHGGHTPWSPSSSSPQSPLPPPPPGSSLSPSSSMSCFSVLPLRASSRHPRTIHEALTFDPFSSNTSSGSSSSSCRDSSSSGGSNYGFRHKNAENNVGCVVAAMNETLVVVGWGLEEEVEVAEQQQRKGGAPAAAPGGDSREGGSGVTTKTLKGCPSPLSPRLRCRLRSLCSATMPSKGCVTALSTAGPLVAAAEFLASIVVFRLVLLTASASESVALPLNKKGQKVSPPSVASGVDLSSAHGRSSSSSSSSSHPSLILVARHVSHAFLSTSIVLLPLALVPPSSSTLSSSSSSSLRTPGEDHVDTSPSLPLSVWRQQPPLVGVLVADSQRAGVLTLLQPGSGIWRHQQKSTRSQQQMKSHGHRDLDDHDSEDDDGDENDDEDGDGSCGADDSGGNNQGSTSLGNSLGVINCLPPVAVAPRSMNERPGLSSNSNSLAPLGSTGGRSSVARAYEENASAAAAEATVGATAFAVLGVAELHESEDRDEIWLKSAEVVTVLRRADAGGCRLGSPAWGVAARTAVVAGGCGGGVVLTQQQASL